MFAKNHYESRMKLSKILIKGLNSFLINYTKGDFWRFFIGTYDIFRYNHIQIIGWHFESFLRNCSKMAARTNVKTSSCITSSLFHVSIHKAFSVNFRRQIHYKTEELRIIFEKNRFRPKNGI